MLAAAGSLVVLLQEQVVEQVLDAGRQLGAWQQVALFFQQPEIVERELPPQVLERDFPVPRSQGQRPPTQGRWLLGERGRPRGF